MVASRDAADGSLLIHQDARIFLASIDQEQQVTFTLDSGRYAWIQVLRGSVSANGQRLHAGDGAAIADETTLTIEASEDAEVMLFDLA